MGSWQPAEREAAQQGDEADEAKHTGASQLIPSVRRTLEIGRAGAADQPNSTWADSPVTNRSTSSALVARYFKYVISVPDVGRWSGSWLSMTIRTPAYAQ